MNKLNQTKSIWVSLLLALTLILGSCSKDFLNTRPVGRVLEVNYYQTEEQAFEALVSIYDVDFGESRTKESIVPTYS